MEIYRGDIFEYEVKGESKNALVVSANFRNKNRFISIIVLTDEPKGEINVPINLTDGTYYADCAMIAFASKERFISFKKVATEKEMKQVSEGIARCLGLEQMVIEKVVEVPVEKVVEIEKPVSNEAIEECGILQEKVTTWKAKAEIFENLYKELLTNVMKG